MRESTSLGVAGTVVVLVLAAFGLWGCPQYAVYSQRLAGEAALARADQDRQIKVREAVAARDAANELAQAEINRAKGVAEANKIIGDSLKGNDAYLRYLWINKLGDEHSEVIYVPTEANLPILEAGKRPQAP